MKNICECCKKEKEVLNYTIPLKPSMVHQVTLRLCDECSNKNYKDYDITRIICIKLFNLSEEQG